MRSVYKFEVDTAKLQQASQDDVVTMFENGSKLIDLVEEFLKTTLGLTKAQVKKMDEEMGQQDLTEMSNYVASRLMGMSDEDIKEQETSLDPKDQ
ncbi:phage tail tube assembly chaperone, partial [Bartonella sp. CL71SXKL]|uniref:phage tail tube assembly chaperone n=1 Tax=Bartonella sp. CL71SXKL TaxID=3243540 RepID=UPI0035D09C4E